MVRLEDGEGELGEGRKGGGEGVWRVSGKVLSK